MRQSQLAKMIYLIRRRDGVSRDELVMHWFKNHMPAVINSNLSATRAGRGGAARYIAQLFASQGSDRPVWDGMAQLWFAEPHPPMKAPAGDPPTDTFQEKCEPYRNWALKEFVVRGGEERLSTDPLTLNDPYPATRSGFFRLNYLVAVKPDTDLDEFYSHWLNVHIPNVDSHLDRAGGFRYIVNHSYFQTRHHTVEWRNCILKTKRAHATFKPVSNRMEWRDGLMVQRCMSCMATRKWWEFLDIDSWPRGRFVHQGMSTQRIRVTQDSSLNDPKLLLESPTSTFERS